MEIIPDSAVRRTIDAYFEAIRTRDNQRWIGLFAENAVVHDPVDAPPAEGRIGLEESWKVFTTPFERLSIQQDAVFYAKEGAAVKWTAEGIGVNEASVVFEGISVFELDGDNRIQTLMAYWDPAAMMIALAGESGP